MNLKLIPGLDTSLDDIIEFQLGLCWNVRLAEDGQLH